VRPRFTHLGHANLGGQARQYRLASLGNARLGIDKGWYSPNFGDRQAMKVMTGRASCRNLHWLGWILQPIDENHLINAGFHHGEFTVQLPDGSMITLPIGKQRAERNGGSEQRAVRSEASK
jgi:hypothetical protein